MSRLKIINPANGRTLETVPADDAQSVAATFRAAREAQPFWAATPLRERIAALRRFRERLVAATPELAKLRTAETGKPITQARKELEGPRLEFFL